MTLGRALSHACIALALASALGCTTVMTIGSHDAARGAPDVGASVPCGTGFCSPGTVCCNASCGICAPPGMGCLDIPCLDAGTSGCSADDATLTGSCSAMLYRWNGSTCEALIGCTCSGRDCVRLRASAALCFEEHQDCWERACRASGATCPAGFFCEIASCTELGGSCRLSPASCAPSGEPVVCGCDGAPYANACEARRLQVSHDESTTCDLCRPALPATVGTCTTLLGYAWDGGRCSAVRGCSCSEGCDRLYPSLAGCTSARTPCLAFPCGALSCRRWEEICVHTGADTRCDPLPGTCEGVPTCACIAATTCAELGAGAFEVTP